MTGSSIGDLTFQDGSITDSGGVSHLVMRIYLQRVRLHQEHRQ